MEYSFKKNSLLAHLVQKLQKLTGAVFSWLAEKQFRLSDLFILGVYLSVVGWGSWKHEPWSDEAFPWLIARDADWRTFLQILFTNQDKHPGLFYLILRPFASAGFPYFTQSIINLVFAVTAAFIFLSRAPFSRIFRYLFLFSFFMVYEYAVIVRTYMLSVMLIFLMAAFYPKRLAHPILYTVLVLLLLYSDYMCLGLGVGLTIAFAVEHWERVQTEWKIKSAFLIMAANAIFILWLGHSLPRDHFQYGEPLLPFQMKNLLMPFANAFSPFSELNANYPRLIVTLAISAGSLIVFLTFMALIGKLIPVMIFGISMSELLLIFSFINAGDYRHHGFILFTVIFVLWIASAYPEKVPAFFREPEETFGEKSRKLKTSAVTMIGLLLFLGLQNIFYVYVLESYWLFSGAKPMAKAIQTVDKEEKIFKQGFVIVAKHKKSIGLLPYLPGVKFWNPCTGDFPKYYKVNRELASCDTLPLDQAIQRTKSHFGDISKVLFLFEAPLPFASDQEYYYERVVSVEKAIFGYMFERFYLYRVYSLPALKNMYIDHMKSEQQKHSKGTSG